MKTLLTTLCFATATAATAQLANASFENWSNLSPHTYDNEMLTIHQVSDPMHGEVDGWTFDYSYGITRTTDATEGSYAVILHNWYSYAQANLIYRGTIASYPQSISGKYKMVDANPADSAIAHIVVKSSANEVMIDKVFRFGQDSVWTDFSVSLELLQNPVNPADSIYIRFLNATMDCSFFGAMTCNLLFLDQLELGSPAAGVHDAGSMDFRIYPNPARDKLYVEVSNAAHNTPLHWEIMDLAGRVQGYGDLEQNTQALDVANLRAGSYFLQLSQHGNILTRQQVLIP